MSTQRERPAGRKPATKRPTHKQPAKKQRAYKLQNPVRVRSPIVRNRRRPKRKTTLAIGSILTAVLTVTVAIVFSVVAAVITGVITGVATGIAAARSEPSQPKQQGKTGGQDTPSGGGKSRTPKPPPGSVVCGASLSRGKGTCSRLTTPGQNCGIPSHPPPAAQQRTA